MRIESPHGLRRYEAVVIAASKGGVRALQTLISALPADFPLPLAVVQHRTSRKPNTMAHVLGRHAALAVKMAENGEMMRPGTVYVAPPDFHLTVRPNRSLAFVDGRKIHHLRSSANPLFESAAESLQGRVIAVVLTGYDRDGTDGVQSVKHRGGIVIAQDQASSERFDMPRSAIQTGSVDHILPLDRIAGELVRLARLEPEPAGAEQALT